MGLKLLAFLVLLLREVENTPKIKKKTHPIKQTTKKTPTNFDIFSSIRNNSCKIFASTDLIEGFFPYVRSNYVSN